MERGKLRAMVWILAAAAFVCAVAAEFKKVTVKEMKLDGTLCSLPRSESCALGIAAIACISVAQLVGTSVAALGFCSGDARAAKAKLSSSVVLLLLSWISFGLAVVMLAAASSMNNGQDYGAGWMNGDCYVAKNGVYGGAAALAVVTAVLIVGFTFTSAAAPARQGLRSGDQPKQIEEPIATYR